MATILSTSFAAAVTDWAATWSLVSVTGVQIGHLCAAESELAQVTAVGPGTTVTVRRGVEATAAAAHATGTAVAVYLASDDRVTPDAPLGAAALPLRQALVTLTNAQVLATWDAPHVLIAAPGANKLIVPTRVTLLSAFVTQYSGDSQGSELAVEHSSSKVVASLSNVDAPPGGVDIQLHTFLTATHATEVKVTHLPMPRLAKALNSAEILSYDGTYSATANANTALQLEAFFHIAGGAAANTLTVSVLYGVLDVTTGVWV